MFKSPDQRQKLRVKRQHEAALLARPGVVGVSLGRGKRRGDAVIRVLTRCSADARGLPKQLSKVPVSSTSIGPIHANVNHRRERPLVGGITISKEGQNGYGTLGLVVADVGGSALALTNFHALSDFDVCALSTSARAVQPASFLGGDEIVASVARYVLDGGDGARTGIDAVVSKIPKEVAVSFGINDIGAVTGIASAALGDRVSKVGSESDRTYGVVTGIGGTLNITYPWGDTLFFFNQITIEATSPSVICSTSGDSGSVWVNASGKAVGLHYAANATKVFAFAQPMQAVADRLGFTVQSPVTAEDTRVFRVRAD